MVILLIILRFIHDEAAIVPVKSKVIFNSSCLNVVINPENTVAKFEQAVLFNTKFFNLVHPVKAVFAMVVIVLGIVILVKAVQLLNMYAGIVLIKVLKNITAVREVQF